MNKFLDKIKSIKSGKNELIPPKPSTTLNLHIPNGNHDTRLMNFLKTQQLLDGESLFEFNNDAPYFLPHYIHEFFLTDSDAQLEKALQDPGTNNLLLDFSTEAIAFLPVENAFSKKLLRMHDIIEKNKYPKRNIYLLNANSVADHYYQNWCAATGKKPLLKIIGYDFYLLEFILAISKKFHEKNYFSAILDTATNTVVNNQLRPKHFCCLNNKFKEHRYAVALQLNKLDLLDKTDFSFFQPATDSFDSFANSRQFISQLNNGQELLAAMDNFNSQLPLIVDMDKTSIEKGVYQQADAPDLWEAIFALSPASKQTFLTNSYLDLVTETWFTNDSCQFITEKTLRPICTLKPFIHVGTPYLLRKLQKLGFQTFSPLINENYDLISDPVARMNAILTEISRLASLSTQQLHELYCELWPRLVHNYFHALRENKQWLNGLMRSLLDSIKPLPA